MRKVVILATLAVMVGGCDNKNTGKAIAVDRDQCTEDTVLSGVEYRPLRSSELYQARGLEGQKVVNEKATKLLGEINYKAIDSSTRVFEECTYKGASFVRVVDPQWLIGDKGWIPESVLKQKKNPENKYEGLIADYLFEDYSPDFFAGKNLKFKAVSKDLLRYQIEAAKKIIDSGSCDHVEGVIFSADKSSLKNLNYIVDCSNKKRFGVSSVDLSRPGFSVVSNSDKAPDQTEAIKLCKGLIERQVVNSRTIEFHDFLDMSYYKAETTGNVRLALGFEAKNKLGQTQGYKAVCIFSSSGEREVTLSQK
ncbi:hypothetical protein KIH32_19255 [Pseudomonas fluorescens]|uniref:hypothetical protein n=1 Tax=Pseudomonas fluorescens TaxID=294 RepID=UPI001BD96175|nr:hypothetical protein [Pseudomonas fluorescens]MBT0626056.1 hypothetical protein [Pseudomonas fluorescens]